MEVSIDATFDTTWSYRIIFSWLVASSGKVDKEIQMMQRRCTSYGLSMVPFAQVTVSRDLFLNPLRAPAILAVRDRFAASLLDNRLISLDYVHDGSFHTDAQTVKNCIDRGHQFIFKRRRNVGHQFVHRSGTLFVRILRDTEGCALVVLFMNNRFVADDAKLRSQAVELYREIRDLIPTLGQVDRKPAAEPTDNTPSAIATALSLQPPLTEESGSADAHAGDS